MKSYKRVLSIAGSDSGGGAGIQADIKSISACGCFATTAITAITVQNTLGVTDVFPVPDKIIGDQIESVLSDIGADAIKIGMLHSSSVILTVKEALIKMGAKNIVLDPVMVSTSGHKLMQDEAISTLENELIGLATLITPNIPEAEILLGREIATQRDIFDFVSLLAKKYNVSVLLKAGHLDDDILIDVLYNINTGEITQIESKRLYTKNTHGTGCTLSSAIASFLAKGCSLEDSVTNGCKYIHKAIEDGAHYKIGEGNGAVNHFGF